MLSYLDDPHGGRADDTPWQQWRRRRGCALTAAAIAAGVTVGFAVVWRVLW